VHVQDVSVEEEPEHLKWAGLWLEDGWLDWSCPRGCGFLSCARWLLFEDNLDLSLAYIFFDVMDIHYLRCVWSIVDRSGIMEETRATASVESHLTKCHWTPEFHQMVPRAACLIILMSLDIPDTSVALFRTYQNQ